ncbi:MAG: hypothetical protein [Bacteriophage sp.]|nr:MAG: hypothetical protein [Bacteriophage sp.]UWH90398.1 MAG: hypothetical protein [Bacteriophage sp.]UWH90539.1 MAG: hypothetical protein [Bacteriophage sp.]UWI19000.1 MAG: hypothetical protein [Bacteriophage sp.]
MEILDYNVIRNNNFDRTKSYFSYYYKSIILFTDYDTKSYNFAVRYNDITKSNELYVILYNDDKVDIGIPIVRDANTGFKLYIPNKVIRLLDTRLRNSFVMSKDDFNINVKFVEERNDFCIIYHIDIE